MTKHQTILSLVAAFCLPVLLYLQTLGFGFTWFDDDAVISKNVPFLSDARNAPKVFFNDAFLLKGSHLAGTQQTAWIAGIFYRPLQTVSFMADIFLSRGNNTWMYHLTNTLLLGLITCLLYLFFRTFSIPSHLSLLSALLYCAHPLFVSSVAWLPARGDLLLSCFSLSSFLLFAEYLQERRIVYLLLHWLAFTAALFCKETAAFLPFIFILYYFTFSSGKPFEKRDLLAIALYAISGICWYWLRSMAIESAPQHQSAVGLMPFISNLRTIPESLAEFLWPFHIAPIPAFSILNTAIGIAAMCLIIALLFANTGGSWKEKAFGLSWFLIFVMPTMLYRNEFYDYLNHRFFLPLIGILLFMIFLIPRKSLEDYDVGITRFMVVAVIVLSFTTAVTCRVYANPLAFYNSVISHAPNNALMYNNRGNVKLAAGDVSGAIGDLTKALELDPNFAVAYYNRGNAYQAESDLAAAIRDYDKFIELKPLAAGVYVNRGIAYDAGGDHEKAIKDFDRAIELDPNNVYAYNSRGLAYDELGEHERAIKDYDKAIERNPNFAAAYCNRGIAYQARHMLPEARRDFSVYEQLTGRK
jgi:tetratricopeptide (TPR) repeat protein